MRKLPLVPTIITFVAVVILLKLSLWQYGRAQEKSELAKQDVAAGQLVYGNLKEALSDDSEQAFKRVLISGSVDKEHLFYWDNRVLEGRVGYEIIAPVSTEAGYLLVNFGWHKDNDFRRSLPEVELPSMLENVLVVLYMPGLNQLTRQADEQISWPALIQQPEISLMSQWLERDLVSVMGYVEQTQQYALENNYNPVTLSPEKHIAYAVQWLLLAIACILVFILALRKKWNDERQQ